VEDTTEEPGVLELEEVVDALVCDVDG